MVRCAKPSPAKNTLTSRTFCAIVVCCVVMVAVSPMVILTGCKTESHTYPPVHMPKFHDATAARETDGVSELPGGIVQTSFEEEQSDSGYTDLGGPPPPLREPTDDELRDLTLAEAIHLALNNSDVIRVDGEFLSPRSNLLQDASRSASIFDVGLQDSGFLFGRRGEEAASADFAPQLSTSMSWRRDENVQNNAFLSGGLTPGQTLYEESAAFTSQVEQVFETGSTATLSSNWNYSLNNQQARLFGSVYTGSVAAQFRHPVLAGSGKEFTQIAGPVGRLNQGVTGVNQGIVIARINSGISVIQFETDVRSLVHEVQQVYWDLHLNYNRYMVQRDIAKNLKEIWKKVEARFKAGLEQGGAADEAQAADNFFQAESTAKLALADVYQTEGRLRRLMGMPSSDGKILHPVDIPVESEFPIEWDRSLTTALMNRPELQKQKMSVRSLQLQLRAANSLTRPRADFVAGYRVNAFGDRLFSGSDNDGVTAEGFRGAVGTLLQGNQTGWNLGFQVSVPLGYKTERAQIRNLRFQLSKANAGLAAQEKEIAHELRNAATEIQRWYVDLQLATKRKNAANRRLAAFSAEYKAGRTSLDLLLRASTSHSEAEVAYYRALSQYNKAITNFYFRAGLILEQNAIRVREGFPTIRTEPIPIQSQSPKPNTELLIPPAPGVLDIEDPPASETKPEQVVATPERAITKPATIPIPQNSEQSRSQSSPATTLVMPESTTKQPLPLPPLPSQPVLLVPPLPADPSPVGPK